MTAPEPVLMRAQPEPRRLSWLPLLILGLASLAAAALVAAAFAIRTAGPETTASAATAAPAQPDPVATAGVAPQALGVAVAGSAPEVAAVPDDPGQAALQPGAQPSGGAAHEDGEGDPVAVAVDDRSTAEDPLVGTPDAPAPRRARKPLRRPASRPKRAQRVRPARQEPAADPVDDDPLAGIGNEGAKLSGDTGSLEASDEDGLDALIANDPPEPDAEPVAEGPVTDDEGEMADDPLLALDSKPKAKAQTQKRSVDDLLNIAVGGSAPAPKALPASPSRADVVKAMDGVRADVKRCAKASGASGGVAKVLVTVHKSGKVTGAKVSGVPDSVAGCVGGAVRHAQFPRFSQPTFSINFPFRL